MKDVRGAGDNVDGKVAAGDAGEDDGGKRFLGPFGGAVEYEVDTLEKLKGRRRETDTGAGAAKNLAKVVGISIGTDAFWILVFAAIMVWESF